MSGWHSGAPRRRRASGQRSRSRCPSAIGAHVTAVDSAAAGGRSREQPFNADNDGYWLIREVRRVPPDQGGDLPAVAFTGLTTTKDRLATLRPGFQYHVPKSVALSRRAGVVALVTLKKSEA